MNVRRRRESFRLTPVEVIAMRKRISRVRIGHQSLIFVGIFAVGAIGALRSASPAASPQTIRQEDYVSAGFFNAPPGVRPANALVPSRFLHARRSYAWRVHAGKRELITFSTPIQHVVIIYMENRTPENLFGAYFNSPAPNHTLLGDPRELDLVNPASASPSPLAPEPLNYTADPNHEHEPAFTSDASGNWSTAGLAYVETPQPGTTSAPSVDNYITLIEHFGYANHVFQSNEGPSFEAHQYAIAAQSGGLVDSSLTPYAMVNNPGHPGSEQVDPDADQVGEGTCFSSPGSTSDTDTTDMRTPYPGNQETSPKATPCNEYPAILDYMASAAPSAPPYDQWQYVAKDATSIWSAPMAIQHLWKAYQDDTNPTKATEPFAVDPDALNFVLNVTSSTSPTPHPARPFAELTYLTPCLTESDHPNKQISSTEGADNGPQWLAWVVDSIETSQYWPNTAIIVVWDDWGGFWDKFTPSPWPTHPVPPPTPYNNPSDPNEWGFRVPLLVISPWVKSANYVSTVNRSQGAILNFVESTFGLTTHALGGDDASNGSDDLSDLFDFSEIATLPPATPATRFSPGTLGTCPPPTQL